VDAAVRDAGGVEPFVLKMASDLSGSLPMKTNQNVEMVSVIAYGRSLAFLSRLVNVDIKGVGDLDALKAANVNYSGCSSPVLGVLIKDHGVDIVYNVTAKGTEYLFQYKLDKNTCSDK
jgi:hypothetical protein